METCNATAKDMHLELEVRSLVESVGFSRVWVYKSNVSLCQTDLKNAAQPTPIRLAWKCKVAVATFQSHLPLVSFIANNRWKIQAGKQNLKMMGLAGSCLDVISVADSIISL